MTVKKQQQSAKPSQDNSWYERSELPPVGCECEAFDSNENKWMRVEVIAIREGYVMMWCRECLCGFQSDDKSIFRPLRTEREKAIDEMVSVIKWSAFHDPEFTASILYDAGYRKVKP